MKIFKLILLTVIPVCLPLLFAFSGLPDELFDKEEAPRYIIPADTARVNGLLRTAARALDQNKVDLALSRAEEALSLVQETDYKLGHLKSLLLLGKAHRMKGNHAAAQTNYFTALQVTDDIEDYPMYKIYTEMGSAFRDMGVHPKALEYFKEALYNLPSDKKDEKENLLKYLSQTHYLLSDFDKALETNNQLVKLCREDGNTPGLIVALRTSAEIRQELDQYEGALACYLEILNIKKKENKREDVANYLNDVAFYYQHLQRYPEALKYFQDALALSRELKKPETENIIMLRNIGVMHQYLGEQQKALESFTEALSIAEKNNSFEEVSLSCSYIATIHMGLGDYKKAQDYIQRSIEYNKEHKYNREKLAEAYLRLSEIYEKISRNRRALDNYKLYAKINDSIKVMQIEALQVALRKSSGADSLNSRLKDAIAESEKIRMEAQTAKLRQDKLEREVELLRRDKEIEDSKTEKDALLKRQQLQAAKQKELELSSRLDDETITKLNLEQEKNQLALAEEAATRKVTQQELEQAKERDEFNKELQKEQEELGNLYKGTIALFAVILILTAVSYYFKRRANRQLKRQQEEILAQRNVIEKSYTNMSVISDIGQEITSTLDFDSLIHTVYTHVSALMPAHKFGIGLYASETERIDYAIYMENDKPLKNVFIDMTENRFAPWVVRNNKAMFMNDIQTDYPQFVSDLDAYKGQNLSEAIICLPLVIKGKVIGIINVQSNEKESYEQYHLDMLQTLASYVSIAVYNARVFNSLKGANETIQEKNRHITDSIRYAQTIQDAVLPPKDKLDNAFADHFVIFQPKDIVSGDFYWFTQTDNGYFVAVVDCTGHGVPGAFMSMVGNDMLDEIISIEGVHEPDEILKQLHTKIYRTLRQDEGKNDDGMDVCLCRIQAKEEDFEVVFAGAKRPLFVTTETGIEEIKGTNLSIGGSNRKNNKSRRLFENQTVKLKKGAAIYLCSDGLVDQNNLNRDKYGTSKFKSTLSQIKDMRFEKQAEILNIELEKHQGKEEQRDDITVLGIRL